MSACPHCLHHIDTTLYPRRLTPCSKCYPVSSRYYPEQGLGLSSLLPSHPLSAQEGIRMKGSSTPTVDSTLTLKALSSLSSLSSVSASWSFSSQPSSSGYQPLDPPEHSLPDLLVKLKRPRPQPNELRDHPDLPEILLLQDHPRRHGMKLKLLLGGIHGDQGCEHDYKMPMSYA
jgi:hypothetical protein